ncbi:MAG: NAD(P)H-dependent oxidoreductase [Planctomycetota bacterium]|nr:NAD(P)H-dependent oxidoreductase [Planctomycetota bacterium]
MQPVSTESLLAQLRWRYAVKKFDPSKKIPEATWAALEQSLVLSPSSYGLQPWRFVVITDPAVKSKLPAISWNQGQPRDCSHMVVLAARVGFSAKDVDEYVQRIVEVRGTPAEMLKDFRGMMLGSVNSMSREQLDVWTAHQVYIALGFVMSAAAMLGVDACPMEGIERAKYDELLGLPAKGYTSVVGCALGYRASDDWLAGMAKVRAKPEDVVLRIS